ncbi:MAG: hypothetical protein VW600_16925, partial [Ferrovibrio sp.]
MSQDRRLPALHILLAHALVAAVVALLILAKPVLLRGFEYPGGDAPRYVVAGMDLLDYGLFSGSAAGETKERFKLVEGGPLAAFELAATFALSPETKNTMRCVLRQEFNTCTLNLRGQYEFHWHELV